MDGSKNSETEPTQELIKEETTPGCYLKVRHVMAAMSFMMLCNVLSLRNNLSVAIVAMVNQTNDNVVGNNSQQDCPERGITANMTNTNGEFSWNSAEQGLLLGCYFYGYIFTAIPGGYLSKRVGVRPVVGISMIASSVLTVLSPVVAKISFEFFVGLRILLGFLQGLVLPAIHAAWGTWAPPLERSQLISITFSGIAVGMLVVLPVSGVIADYLGWEAVFHITGGFSLLWSILFVLLTHNKPEIHPRISEQEKTYITRSIRQKREKMPDVKVRTPWISILTSPRVWAIVIAHFTNNWGNYTLTTMLPTYMSSVLRFNLSASGALSSLPYIMQFILTLAGGYVTDFILIKKLTSVTVIRKINTTVGLVGPAIFLVLAGYIGCDVGAAVAFFSVSVGLSGLCVAGCKSNPIDIAPKYNGVTYGLSNTVSNIAGFLAPQVVGLMLVNDDSLTQWQTVFWVSSSMYCFGAVVYLVLGSGEEQPWSGGKPIVLSYDNKEAKDSAETQFTKL